MITVVAGTLAVWLLASAAYRVLSMGAIDRRLHDPEADADAAAARLAGASNDVGLTGVVFMRDIETHPPVGDADDTLNVRVKTNRPLSSPETDLVRDRLLDH